MRRETCLAPHLSITPSPLYFNINCTNLSPMAPRRAPQHGKPMKTYVVFRGRVPGIYDTWPECQEQVDGYPHHAHQSFHSRREAEEAWIAHVRRTSTTSQHVRSGNPIYDLHGGHDDDVLKTTLVAKGQAPTHPAPRVVAAHPPTTFWCLYVVAVLGLALLVWSVIIYFN